MRWVPRLAILLLVLLAAPRSGAASATTARLILPVDSARPGETFYAGIELVMKPGWHTYWRNGGDSGMGTKVEWTLPEGISAGEIQWPAPERHVLRVGDFQTITYVYHGTVVLLVPMTVAETSAPGPKAISASVSWLECAEQCVPGSGEVSGQFVVGDESRPSSAADRIQKAVEALPGRIPATDAVAMWDGPAEGMERPLVIQWRRPSGFGQTEFYPHESEGFEVSTVTERSEARPGEAILRKTVKRFGEGWPDRIAGVLALTGPDGKPVYAGEALLSVQPVGSAVGLGAGGDGAAAEGGSEPALGLAAAIAFGFLGGIILNVMPCVLPVIALKVLGFVRQAGSRPAETRKLGLIYGLGVWFSFLALAGVILAVRRAAGLAGWGMQFGNPIFLVAMTALVLLVALSLFGAFEINLGGRAMDAAGDLASKEGSAGAFFNGMLAVALATPCTAPFLAPALGYAFTAPAATVVAVFSAVAFGLAAPYVLLSWQPGWLKFVPKAGPWMERFKIAMGFPMLATAIWLFDIASKFFGDGGVLWLGLFLVTLGAAAWVWGEFVQRGRRRQGIAMAIAIGLAAGGYFLFLENELRWREPRVATAAETAEGRKGLIDWAPWSREAVERARAEGRPVFVDFTARWCLTCDLNKRSSIEIASVAQRLKEINAVTLKGDYTRFPPEITQEIQRFKRAGVPLDLVYPKDASKPPIVLPTMLTPGIVLEALDEAVK